MKFLFLSGKVFILPSSVKDIFNGYNSGMADFFLIFLKTHSIVLFP